MSLSAKLYKKQSQGRFLLDRMIVIFHSMPIVTYGMNGLKKNYFDRLDNRATSSFNKYHKYHNHLTAFIIIASIGKY